MKRFLLIVVFIFNLNFNLYSAPVAITQAQLKTYMQSCFAGKVAVNYGDNVSNTITVDNKANAWLLAYGEIEILCMTETYYFSSANDQGILKNWDFRRGIGDYCLGTDYVMGWYGAYVCEPEVGIFNLIPNSIDYGQDDPYCYNESNGEVFPMSAMLHLYLKKFQNSSGVYTHTDSFYWRSFSCSTNYDPNSPDTGSGGTSGTNTTGSSGSAGTSTNSTSLGSANVSNIIQELSDIKLNNSDSQDILVDKLDTANNTLNLTRDDITNLKTDINSKIVDLNLQLETIKTADISQNAKLDSITAQNTNLIADTTTIKTSIDNLALDSNDQINGLNTTLQEKITDDIATYGAIMDKLNGLNTQISALGSTTGDSTTGTNGDLSGIGAGLTNIDNTLKGNLSDENGKPFLKSINDYISNLTKPISGDDFTSSQSSINTAISSSLSDSFTKYSNVLGFGSAYGSSPSNITLNLMGETYTILDFSVLDSYVDIIRSIFLTLAYLYGFMNLLRGGK